MDMGIIWWIQEHLRNGFTDWFFPAVTFLGDKGLIWILLGLALLFFPKYRKWGIAMLCALLLTTLLGEGLLKHLIARPRPFMHYPDLALLIPPPSTYSFPSGHSAASFAAAVVLFRCRRSFGIPALVLAALIAFSRLFLFVHYPTDVLAGILLGTAVGLLTCYLFRKFWQLRPVSSGQ